MDCDNVDRGVWIVIMWIGCVDCDNVEREGVLIVICGEGVCGL